VLPSPIIPSIPIQDAYPALYFNAPSTAFRLHVDLLRPTTATITCPNCTCTAKTRFHPTETVPREYVEETAISRLLQITHRYPIHAVD
jgi:hypothetical protein